MILPIARPVGAACLSFLLLFSTSTAAEPTTSRGDVAIPWNLEALEQAPEFTWGETVDGVRELYYQGEPLDGEPTRIFAYYATPAMVRPDGDDGTGNEQSADADTLANSDVNAPAAATRSQKHPAMVLVHGGGGTAFAEWARLWARRGYCAIAMDLGGCGPNRKPLPDGMPTQGDGQKFAPFDDTDFRKMWTYHAVAAVVRGHSWLAARPEVDADRIGITGISWGGYLTCIVAGIDDRLKAAVPVYGCGFLHENSVWLPTFKRIGDEQTARWIRYWDPSQYLGGVQCPILFVNGTHDFAYPLDSYQKSYRLVTEAPRSVRIEVKMPHGHPQGWKPQEIGVFVDSVLKDRRPLPALAAPLVSETTISARVQSQQPIAAAGVHWTTDSGPWTKREWVSRPAIVENDLIVGEIPTARPIVVFLSVTDDRGCMVTTEHVTLDATVGDDEQ